MKSPKFDGSVGSQIIISQQQLHHQKRLKQIYHHRPITSKTFNQKVFLGKSPSHLSTNCCSKKSFDEEFNHQLTIKHLIERLNSPKSYQDRIKDPQDFIVYPALFFRKKQETNPELKAAKKGVKKSRTNMRASKENNVTSFGYYPEMKTGSKKQGKSKKVREQAKKVKIPKDESQSNITSQSINSQAPYNGLTVEKVIKQLPKLAEFEKEDIERFADALTQIIFKYNLNTMEDVQFLFGCVEEYLPEDYPEHFVDAVEEIFAEIVDSLNIGNN